MAKNRAEELTEDEKKALRGSKFAPLPSLPPPRTQPRLAHPGGPLTTNKAAALAKFLERKLQDPDGLGSMNPELVERAVQNAKRTVFASAASNSQGRIRHVNSFGDDSEDPLQLEVENVGISEAKKKKKNKKKKNKQKVANERFAIDGYLSFTFFHCLLLVCFANLVSNSGVLQIVEDIGGAVVRKPKKKKLKL